MSSENATTEDGGMIPPDLRKDWMSMTEACTALARSRFTVWKLTKEKILVRSTYGSMTLISRESVAKWLTRLKPGQAKTTTSGKKATKRKAMK
jgi:hypothetical protein